MGDAALFTLSKIEVRRLDTGEVREVTVDSLLHGPYHDFPPFIWEEGNYSCDCNLHIFFERAGKPPPPVAEAFGFPCGEEFYGVRLKSGDGEVWAYKWEGE